MDRGQTRSAAFSLDEMSEVAETFRQGAVLIDPDDLRVRFANARAPAILGRPADDLIGKRLGELVEPTEAGEADETVKLVAHGTVQTAKVLLRIDAADGRQHIWAWLRTSDLVAGSVVVALLVPERVGTSALLSSPLLPGDHLALGVTDCQWSITRVSDAIRALLGCQPAALRGQPLFGLLHPEDAVPTMQAVAAWDDPKDSLLTVVRARHADGSWRPVQLLISPLEGDQPPLLVFLMTEAGGPQPTHQPTARIAQLERHLLRIAMEVQAADVAGQVPALPDVERFPALRGLSDRQWEVLTRLLAGERVPGIASRMHLSQSTVRNHLAAIFQRFAVHSQSELLELLKTP